MVTLKRLAKVYFYIYNSNLLKACLLQFAWHSTIDLIVNFFSAHKSDKFCYRCK